MLTNTSDEDKVKITEELKASIKASVIEPQNIPEWGYGFYQHNLHREISILSNRLNDDLISKLKEHALSHRDIDYRYKLAGQIAEEYDTPYDDAPELKSELDAFLRQQVQYFLGMQPSDEFDWHTWTNISKPGEFNPVHAHTNCILSFIIYLDIPEAIRHEYYDPITTIASKGLITFYSSYSSNDLVFNPRTADFFLFTSNHRHSVGAFYTEGAQRISLAGNIIKL